MCQSGELFSINKHTWLLVIISGNMVGSSWVWVKPIWSDPNKVDPYRFEKHLGRAEPAQILFMSCRVDLNIKTLKFINEKMEKPRVMQVDLNMTRPK